MCQTFCRTILLVGLGVGAGFAHAYLNKKGDSPLILTLPMQQGGGAQSGAEQGRPEAKATPNQAVPPEAPAGSSGAAAGEGAASEPTATAAAPTPAAADDGYLISVARAKELYDGKRAGTWDGIFIDARPYVEYTAGHIPGSMHIDKKYFDGGIPAKIRNYLPGMPVVIYCHGEDCTDSEAVAARLLAMKRDIGPIYIIREGLPGWEKAGHPIEKGPEVGFD